MPEQSQGTQEALDAQADVVSYVLLTRRGSVSPATFSNFWKDVHGPLAARIPRVYQYRQYHVERNLGGLWPELQGVNTLTPEEDQVDGFAELTFRSREDHQAFTDAAGAIQDDERNVFGRSVGYNTFNGHSRTLVDRLDRPLAERGAEAVHLQVLLRHWPDVNRAEVAEYVETELAPDLARSPQVSRLRFHLLSERDNSPDVPRARNVDHDAPGERQYQIALELSFEDMHALWQYFDSDRFATTTASQSQYFRDIQAYRVRELHTFVEGGRLTTAGLRGASVADLIRETGATNQLEPDVEMMFFGQ